LELGIGEEGGKPERVAAVKRIQQEGPGILSEAFVAKGYVANFGGGKGQKPR